MNNKIRSKKKNLNNPRLNASPMLSKNDSRPGKNLVIVEAVGQFSIDKAHNLYNDAKRVGKISFNHIRRRAKKVRKNEDFGDNFGSMFSFRGSQNPHFSRDCYRRVTCRYTHPRKQLKEKVM